MRILCSYKAAVLRICSFYQQGLFELDMAAKAGVVCSALIFDYLEKYDKVLASAFQKKSGAVSILAIFSLKLLEYFVNIS